MNDRIVSCREVQDLIDLYVSDDLAPGEADGVRTHLGRCEACRAEADAFRRQHERLASLSSSQMPSGLGPFFWQGIQREILVGEGEAEEPVEAAPRRRVALRPILYALAALVLVAVTVFAAVEFFGDGAPAAPQNDIVDVVGGAQAESVSQEVPFIRDNTLAPAGRPDTEEIDL